MGKLIPILEVKLTGLKMDGQGLGRGEETRKLSRGSCDLSKHCYFVIPLDCIPKY